MKMLVMVTDAFGGRGGIARFNRDLLTALCDYPDIDYLEAFPRLMPDEPGPLPAGLRYRTDAAGSRWRYVFSLLQKLASRQAFHGVLCGHINLLPLAALASTWLRAPLVLVIHGIDAWKAPESRWVLRAMNKVDIVVSVSAFTRDRFLRWSTVPAKDVHVVPNCVNAAAFGPGDKSAQLLNRHTLEGKTVLMTLCRLSAQERYKGVDEMLELVPDLAEEIPDIAYVIAGDGDDRARLEQKAKELGIQDRVVFTGYIPEAEKVEYYRIADAFVMPGRGEGFGIVYLEALACGIPVVASSADASREAVLDGAIGQVVNPDEPEDIKRGIMNALQQTGRSVPDALNYFSFNQFKTRWYRILGQIWT